jgi:hypothetical protein
MKVKATGHDPETDIGKVVFFLGKLTKEGDIPKDAIQAVGSRTKDKDNYVWTAELDIPADKTETLDLGVRFTNTAGLPTTTTAAVKLVDPKPRGATITGEVMENGRPQRGQAVQLYDLKGMKLVEVKTNNEAKFEFKDVPAGDYNIVVEKGGANTRGEARVKVAAGKQVVLKEPIELKLK